MDGLGLHPPPVGFTYLFGGPHLSQPSFVRAGVSAGDTVFPVAVTKGKLQVLGRARVETITRTDDIPFRGFDGVALDKTMALIARSGWPEPMYFRCLQVSCTDHVLSLSGSAGPWTDLFLPPEDLRRFTFRNRRGIRRPKGVETGVLKTPMAFQGIYRLEEETETVLNRLVDLRLAGKGRAFGEALPFEALWDRDKENDDEVF